MSKSSRKKDLSPVGKWARVVICESGVGGLDWVGARKVIARKLGMRGMVFITPFFDILKVVLCGLR